MIRRIGINIRAEPSVVADEKIKQIYPVEAEGRTPTLFFYALLNFNKYRCVWVWVLACVLNVAVMLL